MKHTNLESDLDVDGLKIHYKVEVTDSSPDKSVFVVSLGNPPFTMGFYDGKMQEFYRNNENTNVNFISVDYPGCGKSSSSPTPLLHYTVEFYAKAVAAALENIRYRLALSKMQVIIQAPSNGSLVAMNLINLFPEWTKDDADIALRMIVNVNPIVSNESLIPYIQQKNANDKNLGAYIAAQTKLENGLVKDTPDFISNVQAVLVPLTGNLSFLERMLLSAVKMFPRAVPRAARFLHERFPNTLVFAYLNEAFHLSAAVSNSFTDLNTNKFNLLNTIAANKEAYQRPIIVNITGANNRHEPHRSESAKLKEVLKDNVTEVVLPESQNFFDNVNALMGNMNTILAGKFKDPTASQSFQQKLKKLNANLVNKPVFQNSSTAKALNILGHDEAATIAVAEVQHATQATEAVDYKPPQSTPTPDYKEQCSNVALPSPRM